MSSSSTTPGLPAFLQQSKTGELPFLANLHCSTSLTSYCSPDVHAKFIDLEWQQRNRLLAGTQPPTSPSDPPSRWARLSGDAVAARNRYLNVEPFAQNRVKLKVAEGLSDYINASPIQLGKRRYIATQGPKDTNVNHFYCMLSSEVRGTAVVIMLTQTHEAGKEKCFQYYPLSAEESPLIIPPDAEDNDAFAGSVDLLAVEDDPTSRSQIRHMRLQTQTAHSPPETKEIKHLLFTGWPDFLTPEGDDRTALTHLIQLSARLNTPPSSDSSTRTNGSAAAQDFSSAEQDNPRIVHCSAGVGRSGTFIALDYLLARLHAGELDNVPADVDPICDTVDELRQQRMMMVQGEGQFHFVYEVLRDAFALRAKGGADAVAGAEPGT